MRTNGKNQNIESKSVLPNFYKIQNFQQFSLFYEFFKNASQLNEQKLERKKNYCQNDQKNNIPRNKETKIK